jgi:alkanesulfonate monooxygenase SsuD/methylene tetrahydromethanopterin reductase-like flavin-dependent oxidoreductase (luciferase family)
MARHPWVAEADKHLRWGIRLDLGDAGLGRLLDAGRTVEELGFDGCYLCDHPSLQADPWIGLAALAAVTKHVRLGPVVSCASYRHPAYLARIAADLDTVSGGRLMLGLGIGWMKPEFEAFGVRFDPARTRYTALEEALAIICGAWGVAAFGYAGEHFQIGPLRVAPPIQQPRPPLMIGGNGEQRTLRLVARYADACNVDDIGPTEHGIERLGGPERIRRKFALLREYCEELGRPYDEVLRTHFTLRLVLAHDDAKVATKLSAFSQANSGSAATRQAQASAFLAGTPQQVAPFYQALVDAGAQYFVIQVDSRDVETLELLAHEVVPHIMVRF